MKKEKVDLFNDRVQDEIERNNYFNNLFHLFEKNLLSKKTMVEYFGFDYNEEMKNIAEEKGVCKMSSPN